VRGLSIERFIEQNGELGVRKLTGFLISEIDELVVLVTPAMTESTNGRDGPSYRSRLFAFLAWVATGVTYEDLGIILGCSKYSAFRAVNYVYVHIRDIVVDTYVPRAAEFGRRDFVHFPEARFVVDATLIEIERPGDRNVAAEHLSGKHRRYGVKVQVVVNSDGKCCHMSEVRVWLKKINRIFRV